MTTEQRDPATLSEFVHLAAVVAGGGVDAGPELIQTVLAGIRDFLGTDAAFIGEFTGDRRVIRYADGVALVRPGDGDALEDTYCQRVVDGRLPELGADVAALPAAAALPITRRLNIGAYLTVPIEFSDGRVYGTLCALSGRADTSLRERDLTVVRLLAGLLGRYFEREIDTGSGRAHSADVCGILAAGDLTTVFQPIVDLETGRAVGYEALSRFPTGRPDEWFAKAARAGLGVALELAAVNAAVEHLADVPGDAYLAVNLSPATVRSTEFAALASTLPLTRLVLEVTEHTDDIRYDELSEGLAPLRAAGARIAVDDAGSGYAGLQRILALAPDIVKLDLELTRGIAADPARQALAAAMSIFADRTAATLVAEGIETQADLDALRELGVRYGQGYHLGRPQQLPEPGVPRARRPR